MYDVGDVFMQQLNNMFLYIGVTTGEVCESLYLMNPFTRATVCIYVYSQCSLQFSI